MDRLNLWDLEQQVEMAMDALQCPPGDADVNNLSGGERRRVALCRLLLEQPGFLQESSEELHRRHELLWSIPTVVRLTLAFPLLAVEH